jgi:hypothetical protein
MKVLKRISKVVKIGKFLILVIAIISTGYCHIKLKEKLYDQNVPTSCNQTWLPSIAVMRLISLGYERLWADLYWLAFIQYIGDQEACLADKFSKSYNYLNLITQLDPHFVLAYWFAAFTIGSDMKRPDLADAIIARGIENNKNDWFLPYIAGVNQYLFAKNEAKAAKFYRMAAKFPDSPPWMARQAIILEAKIPSQIKEIGTWEAIYSSQSNNSLVKDTARTKLINLWLKIYKEAPSAPIKKRAKQKLNELGIDVQN